MHVSVCTIHEGFYEPAPSSLSEHSKRFIAQFEEVVLGSKKRRQYNSKTLTAPEEPLYAIYKFYSRTSKLLKKVKAMV